MPVLLQVSGLCSKFGAKTKKAFRNSKYIYCKKSSDLQKATKNRAHRECDFLLFVIRDSCKFTAPERLIRGNSSVINLNHLHLRHMARKNFNHSPIDAKIFCQQFYDCRIGFSAHRRSFNGNQIIMFVNFLYFIFFGVRFCFDYDFHLNCIISLNLPLNFLFFKLTYNTLNYEMPVLLQVSGLCSKFGANT